MKTLKQLLLLAPILMIAQFSLAPVSVFASTIAQSNAANSACSGIGQLDSTQSCSSGSGSISNIISEVVNILSIILGAIAIIMIIVSGIRFATAGGSSNGVSGAKNTLIYAIIGLVIAALAQVIVRWVIGTSSTLSNGSIITLIHNIY
ncbi:MAG: hypothetical protein ACREF7_04200 [Candidatus Saccharimonadales bacterium]